jgi:hypothetical protein
MLPNDAFNAGQLSFLLGLCCSNAFDDVRRSFRHKAFILQLFVRTGDEASQLFSFLFLVLANSASRSIESPTGI